MSDLFDYFQEKFKGSLVTKGPILKNTKDLIQLKLKIDKLDLTICITDGMRSKKMEIPAHMNYPRFTECFFCLPSYWDFQEVESEKMRWPFEWLEKITNYFLQNDTWFGPGHTFSNGTPPMPFSTQLKANHLIMMSPIMLNDVLSPVTIGEQTISFLALVPIFEQEFDVKIVKGYDKFLAKFLSKNGTEIIDDYRQNIFQSRFKLF